MNISVEQDLPTERDEIINAPPYVPDPTPATRSLGHELSAGVTTVYVPRPVQPGTRGVEFTVTTNHFAIDFSDKLIYHYDAIEKDGPEPKLKWMPRRWNQELIRILQEKVVPTVFTPRAVYDGRKNLYSSRRLPLRSRNKDLQTFNVTPRPPYERPAPPVYKVSICLVGHINPAALKRYCLGQVSADNEVQTSFAPLNIILKMKSFTLLPLAFNGRRFFADQEMRSLGGGIELWRGYFQSIRPGVRSLLVNIDASSGSMFAPGPMIRTCGQILGDQSPLALIPGGGLSDRSRIRLQQFLRNVRFVTAYPAGRGRGNRKPKVVKALTTQGASSIRFTNRDGLEQTVSQYFLSVGITLDHPELVCIETPSGAVYPIELCYIIPGQIMRRHLPPELQNSSESFMRQAPQNRLNSIVAGYDVLGHDTSEYMRSFGMSIDPTPEKCLGRMLRAPLLDYGQEFSHRPQNGSWNFRGRKLYEPVTISGWAMVVLYERGFGKDIAQQAVSNLVSQATQMGIRMDRNPPIIFAPAQIQDVSQYLRLAGHQVVKQYHIPAPQLLVVVLPPYPGELYRAIKYFANITTGVVTQCLQAIKARGTLEQYWAHVCLKINAKLGGINLKLNLHDIPTWVFDPDHPLMIIASRVSHPAPGTFGHPSFAAVVGSLDSNAVRYAATNSIQSHRMETISNLEEMVYDLISRHVWWKTNREKQSKTLPERIIYYHGGVSDGELPGVVDGEISAIQAACRRHDIKPKITMIIVDGGHCVRFFPTHGLADPNGNCPAGTVVDNVVGSPQAFDFYLQSQPSITGTSRPSHYSVVYDDNNFNQDGVQGLTYALCHLTARSTRATLIPAPLHYARMVCGWGGTHYDPSVVYEDIDVDDPQPPEEARQRFFRDKFTPVHNSLKHAM